MPRYTVILKEIEEHVIIVDGRNKKDAAEAADEAFLASDYNIFESIRWDRRVVSVNLAEPSARLSADEADYGLSIERTPIERAAPDMLEALKLAMADGFLAGESLDAVATAIAKAEGGAA